MERTGAYTSTIILSCVTTVLVKENQPLTVIDESELYAWSENSDNLPTDLMLSDICLTIKITVR